MTTAAPPHRLVLRVGTARDLPAVHDLAARAVRDLLGGHFLGPEQVAAAAAAGIHEVEPDLLRAGTYYVAEIDGEVVAGGGWSAGGPLYPGSADARRAGDGTAAIRAIYVDPRWARRGLAGLLVRTAETAATIAGNVRFEALCTPPSEALLRTFGYVLAGRGNTPIGNGLHLPAALMRKGF